MKLQYIAVFVFILLAGSTTPTAFALQQVAGKIEIIIKPGETQSFKWGLLSDIEEESEIGLTANGSGSEFLSFPEMVKLGPKQLVYVSFNVTIPKEHPGNASLSPVLAATQFGKPGGQTIINIQMQKTVNITIEPNPASEFKEIKIKSFPQKVKLNEKQIDLMIQSSSEINNFTFSPEKRQISFIVSGLAGTNGTVTIPVSDLLRGPYNVMIDGKSATDFETINNNTSMQTSIKVDYAHSSHTIAITGASVVPEFPLAIFDIILTILVSGAIVLSRIRMLSYKN